MYRVCSSRTTASRWTSQPLTVRKSNASSVTAPSQNASRSTKNANFDFSAMSYSTNEFFHTLILSV